MMYVREEPRMHKADVEDFDGCAPFHSEGFSAVRLSTHWVEGKVQKKKKKKKTIKKSQRGIFISYIGCCFKK